MTNFADLFISEDIVANGGGAIAVSDGTNIYTGIEQLTFNGTTLIQNGGVVTITVSGGGGGGGAIAVSDGVNIYSGIEQLNFNGATLSQQGAIITISVSGGGGGGDMDSSVYDLNGDGIVDNASALEGNNYLYYLTRSNHIGTQPVSTITGLGSSATLDAGTSVGNLVQLINDNGIPALPPVDGSNLLNISTSADMQKSVYDSNDNGIVDQAEAIAGSPSPQQYYGTNNSGVKGFHNLPEEGVSLNQIQAIVLAGLTI